jgi:hypothetical protein
MTAPDPVKDLAVFRHRVRAGDYAAAALMVSQPAVLDALAALSGYAERERAEADAARREAAAVRLAEAERARVQALIAPLLDELIGVLAEALGMPRGAVCIACKRVLRRYRNCPYCGTRDARTAAPVSPGHAERNRDVPGEAMKDRRVAA